MSVKCCGRWAPDRNGKSEERRMLNGVKRSREERIQEMLDHYEITKTVNIYCHGCDRMDHDMTRSTYLEDSWDDHGMNKCPGPEFVRRLMESLPHSNMCTHVLGQTLINVTGDDAGAETYFIAIMRTPGAREGDVENLNMIGGRYADTLRRVDDEWLVKKRICIRDWSITQPITEDWLIGKNHALGHRSDEDPSYSVLGLKHSGQFGAGMFATMA
ncbi:MAG: nuclear transport factor 2 family protein [Sphingomonadales bacterium]|nr:MAG: nuclear transport factor 2 family protein [Sphingomonadales bacterium]